MLSPAGREVVDAATTDHVASEAILVSSLTPNGRKILDRTLRNLLQQFEPSAT